MPKREIAHHEKFLLLPQCYQRYSVIILSFKEIFNILKLISHLLQICCIGARVDGHIQVCDPRVVNGL